jgi:hypothetical protein
MMTLEEFEQGMNKLKSVYGDKAYPADRSDLILKIVKYSTPFVWMQTISEVIGEFTHPPPISKFKEVYYAMKKKYGDAGDPFATHRHSLEKLRKISECGKCIGGGIVYATRRDGKGASIPFACECEAGGIAHQLPEYRCLTRWTQIIEDSWSHEFENLIDGTRELARANAKHAIRSSDLNAALGNASVPRQYKDDSWDENL